VKSLCSHQGFFLALQCQLASKKNNLAKKWQKIVNCFLPKNFDLEKNLDCNHQIIDENKIMDM